MTNVSTANAPAWPRQSECRAFYGAPGTNQVVIDLPYLMTYDGRPVRRMTINRRCADSAIRALTKISREYTEAERKELGLSIFGGCFNNRKMRGGSALSMHAYACAIDFDPARNQLRWGRDKARLAKPDCEAFWRAWEEEGWVSLGRLKNFDWMHVQAARL